MPLPGENDVLKFTEIAKQFRVPFVIYTVFETYVKPIQTWDLDPNSSHTCNISDFEPCGFAYHIVLTDKRYNKPPTVYRGNEIADTNERYVSFTISKLRFIDSFQFLTTSFDILVKNLKLVVNNIFINSMNTLPPTKMKFYWKKEYTHIHLLQTVQSF